MTWRMPHQPDDDQRRTYLESTPEPDGAGTVCAVDGDRFRGAAPRHPHRDLQVAQRGWSRDLSELWMSTERAADPIVNARQSPGSQPGSVWFGFGSAGCPLSLTTKRSPTVALPGRRRLVEPTDTRCLRHGRRTSGCVPDELPGCRPALSLRRVKHADKHADLSSNGMFDTGQQKALPLQRKGL